MFFSNREKRMVIDVFKLQLTGTELLHNRICKLEEKINELESALDKIDKQLGILGRDIKRAKDSK